MAAARGFSAARTGWNDRVRDPTLRALDAVTGSPPEVRSTLLTIPEFSLGALALRAGMWGLALGALAPATTALDVLSGLAADDISYSDTGDLGFFFGFVPLAFVLVALLLSWNYWPLRDLRSYHREMFVGLLAVGVAMLVELRAHGARVTDDRYDHEWVLVSGSLAIHALLIYGLVRVAARDVTRLHASRAGWPRYGNEAPELGELADSRLDDETPRYAATAALALRTIIWGVAIGAAAGAAAGTLIVPVLGTLVGAYLGAVYGLVPTVLGTVAVVTVVSWRRDTDPAALHRAVQVTLLAGGVVTVACTWPFLHSAPFRPEAWQDANLLRMWLIIGPTILLILRKSAARLAETYARLVGPKEPTTY
ncbi:MAG TPA: hypothetical protein VGJ86_09810 [Acidimicrobiales bacterium]|jgi:hypothetical protein